MKMPSDQTLQWVNELLPGAGPIGAYAMGIATTSCCGANVHPTRALLEEMRGYTSIPAAAQRVDEWIGKLKDIQARRRSRRGCP